MSWPLYNLLPWLVALFVLYSGVCRVRRLHQRNNIEADYYRRRGSSLSSMTFEDAWKIQKWLAEQEFPKTLSTAVFFALFKVWTSFAPSIYSRHMLIIADLRHSFNLQSANINGTHDELVPIIVTTYCRYGSTSQ